MPSPKINRNPIYDRTPEYQGGNSRTPIYSDDVLQADLERFKNNPGRFMGNEEHGFSRQYAEQERKFKKDLETYEDAISPPLIDEEGKKYRTPEEKEEYKSLIRQKIENLKQLQKGIMVEDKMPSVNSFGVPMSILDAVDKNKRSAEINKQIIELRDKEKAIEKELSPVTDQEIKSTAKIFEITDPKERVIAIAQAKKDLGPRFDRIMREDKNKAYSNNIKEIYDTLYKDDKLVNAKNFLKSEHAQYQQSDPNLKLDKDLLDKTKKDIFDLDAHSPFFGSNQKYREADFNKKRDAIDGKANEYANEGTNADGTPLSPEQKAKRKAEYLKHALHSFMFERNGDITIEGTKLLVESDRDKTQEWLKHVQSELANISVFEKDRPGYQDQALKVAGISKFGEAAIGEKSRYESPEMSEYADYLKREIRISKSAIEKYNAILEMPETRGGISDAYQFKAVKRADWKDILTIGVKSMLETLELKQISDKLTDWEELTLSEENYLKTFATLNFINSEFKPEGIWYQAQKGAINMIPYVASFLITGGAYSVGRKGVYQGVKGLATKELGKATVGKIMTQSTVNIAGRQFAMADIAAKNVARISGTAFQTLFNPQMYLKSIATELAGIPQMEVDEYGNTIATIDRNTKEELGSGIYKGMVDTFGEILMERSGGYLLKAVSGSYLMKALGGTASGKKVMQSAVLKRMKELKPYTTMTKLNEEFIQKKLGWNGIMKEYLEELATHFFKAGMTGEDFFPEGFGEEQLTTFLTVAMFGGFMRAGKWGTEKVVGNNVRFDSTDPKTGEVTSVKLPLNVYEDLNKIFEGKELVNGQKIDDLIEKYKGKLSKDQIKLILDLSVVNGRKKAETLAYNSAKVGDSKETVITSITKQGPTQEGEVLTPEDRREVTEENVRIANQNKDLSDLDLLIMDDISGQYLEPTKTQIQSQLRSTNDQLSKIDLTKEENKISKNEEVALLFKRQAVLQERLKNFREQDKAEWDDKTASRQQEQLTVELDKGETLKGKASKGYGAKTGILITLNDGRIVKGFAKKNLSNEDQKALNDAIVDNKDFELEKEDWETWNPERTIVDERGLPFEHRININIRNAKGEKITVGIVRVTDDFTAKKKAESEKVKTDKADEAAMNTLNSEIKKRGSQAPMRRKFVSQKPVEDDVDLERPESAIDNKAEIERLEKERKEKLNEKNTEGYSLLQLLSKSKERLRKNEKSRQDAVDKGIKGLSEYDRGIAMAAGAVNRHNRKIKEINAEYDAKIAALKDIDRTSEMEMYLPGKLPYEENYGLEHLDAVDELESFMKKNGIEYDQKYGFKQVNEKMIDKKTEPFVHAILSALSGFIDTMQTDIVFVNRYRYNKKGDLDGAAEYDHVDNRITMYIPAIARKYVVNKNMEGQKVSIQGKTHIIGVRSATHMLQKVWGHEVNHAFTVGKLSLYEGLKSENPLYRMIADSKNVRLEEWEKLACQNIDFIYQFIKEKHPEFIGEYGLKNLREFVAEALSNEGFAVKLMNVKLPQHLQYKPHTKNVLHALAEIIKDFINAFMKNFGMAEKSANNAFDAVSSFVNDLARTYNSNDHLLSSITLASYFEFKQDIERSAMQEIDNIDDESRKNIQESLYNAIDTYTKSSDMSAGNVLPIVKSWIKRAENLSDYEKAIWNMIVDRNADTIIKHAITRTLARKGLIKKEKIVEPSDLDIPDLDMFIMTGKQKIEAITSVLARFWEAIAQKTGRSRDTVIHTFYSLAKEPTFKEMVTDDATFKEYLNSIRGRDDITETLIDIFSRSKLDDVLSLFLFYGDMNLTRYYGMTIRDGKMSWDLLNPSERYSEFVDRFRSFISRKGTDEIKTMILKHSAERTRRFQVQNYSYSVYERMSPEQRESLRREQHEADLEFLQSITGLDKELWRQYFVKRTKETLALSSKEAANLAEYGTYDNLLKHDTFRKSPTNNAIYHRVQSNLMFQLSLLPGKADFAQVLEKFFTEGNPDENVYSNLYKLSTAIVDRNDIGLSGIDVKGDRFNSFLQTSHMQVTAENIQQLGITNSITEFYAKEERVPEIILFGGIRDASEGSANEAFESGNLSSRDFWKSMLWVFMKGEEFTNSKGIQKTYLQWLGQYGDKSSIAVVEVPKYIPTTEEIEKKRKEYKDFDKIVEWMFRDQLINQSSFKDYTNNNHEKLRELIQHYVYNFIENINPLNQVFHGDLKSYESFTDLVKRAATTNSPGYRAMTNIINGLGQTYTFAVAKDTFGVIKKGFDGIEFMSGEYAAALQVSMGSMFGKKIKYPVLSGVKGLTSFTDPQTNLRGLTKVNFINIDVYCDSHPEGSVYHQIRDQMKKHGIDRLGFVSGNKKNESSYGDKAVIDLFEDQGNVKKKVVIPKDGNKVIGIVTRDHNNFFIQQDLRHETTPKEAKMSSQLLSNVLHLPHGHQISSLYNQIQQTAINELITEVDGKVTIESKLEWLREKVDPYTQREIAELLDAGLTLYDPFLRTYFNRMVASAFTRKALEIPVSRIATQEIADFTGALQGRRKSISNPKYILLPDIATTIDGGRYHDYQFVEKNKGDKQKAITQAIAHVSRNREKYADLYDENGILMEHEIIDRDGMVPGELLISVRTPNDDLHSMTVGRLAFPIAHGNFTMLDKESQRISGSDFDGDQRFNILLYKDGKKIQSDQTRRGLVNKMILSIAYDYVNPKVDPRIKAPIDVEIYDDILEELKKGEEDYSDQFDNILGYDKARNENLTGVKMKGSLTNMNTIYKILSGKKVRFKNPVTLRIAMEEEREEGKDQLSITLSELSNDQYDMMSMHISNILNMAFDNAQNPRIERMGLNEHTVDMWITALIANPNLHAYKYKNAKAHSEAIKMHVEDLIRYFRQPMMEEFTSLMRNGYEVTRVKEMLTETYGETTVGDMISFYYKSQDFKKLRNIYSLTQEMPETTSEYLLAKKAYQDLKNNDFDLIDTRALFNSKGDISNEFKIIQSVIDIADEFVINDNFENTLIGGQILNAIIKQLEGKKGKVKKAQLDSVIQGINTIAAIRAMGLTRTIPVLRSNLVQSLLSNDKKTGLRQRFPNNKFLEYIIIAKGGRIAISQEFKWAKFTEQQITDIRNDFDALPEEVKEDFAMYAIANWGVHTSSFKGSYAKLIGNQYRIYISEKLADEFTKWFNDDITSAEKYQIMQTVLRGSRIAEVRKKAEIDEGFDGAYEYNILADKGKQDYHINLDSLEGIEKNDFKDYQELADFAAEKSFDAALLVKYAIKEYGTGKVLSYANKLLSEFREKANQVFPPNKRSKDEIKDMMLIDALGEALATEDPALESFIFAKLKERYPGVVFFTDRQAFYNFVHLNGGRNQDISFSAIGHAFKNAVFIDTENAVQSTTIHEHAHIYWDALPDNNKAKERLRDVVAKNFPELTDEFSSIEELDEFIIVQIGRAGIDVARVELKAGLIGEFMNALKDFWVDVKKFFGVATQKDLIFSMAMDIWNNKEKINPQTIPGQAYIRNMVSYDNQIYDGYRNAKENKENFYIDNIPVHGVTKVISKIAPEIFDAEKIAKETVGRWDFMRTAITHRKLTVDQINAEKDRLTQLWKANTETGTVMHAMLQYFADIGNVNPAPKPNITPQNVTNWFANWDAYSQFFAEAESYIEGLKNSYPEAKFHTEKLFISKKFGIGGYADLVIELPDNKLIIIDFKSTDKDFVDASPEAELRNHYKQAFGKMAAPFRFNNSKFNKHSLQLNMYGLMAEEQEDIDNPGQRNTIESLRIVPIVRTVNEEGKIESATIGRTVLIPNNENFKRNAENVMAYHSIKAKAVNENNDYREKLEQSGIAPQAIDMMVEAYKYLLSTYGDPRKIDVGQLAQSMADLRSSVDGFKNMMAILANFGYTNEDFESMPLEHLFYIAFHSPIKRNAYEDMKDELFPEFEVGRRFKSVKNTEKPKRIWSHLTINERDCYLKEVGIEGLRENDEILMIYDFSDSMGKPRRETYFYTVSSIDKKNKEVLVVDPDTKEIVKLKAYISGQGFQKVYNAMPEGLTIPEKDSYIPRRIFEVETIKERHYKDFMTEEQYMEKIKDNFYPMYRSDMRRIWNFFKKVPNMKALLDLMEDSEAIAEWLRSFDTIDASVTGRLGLFLQDENVNHWMAQQLKREHDQITDSPSHPLPFTFLFHQLFASGKSLDSHFSQDFSFPSAFWGWLPPEMLDVSNTALSTFYQSAAESFGLYTEVKFELEYDFKKFADKVNMEVVTIEGRNGTLWRMPSEVTKGTIERDFLEMIYDYHIKYDSDIRDQQKSGMLERIPVSHVYMSYEEFVERYGKWGRIMYQKLKPTAFDHIRLMVPLEDGTESLMTLREIKDAFIFNESSPEQAREFFGDRVWQILKPGTTQALISVKAGQLDKYIKEAKKVYTSKRENDYNSEVYLRKKSRSIPIIGKSRMKHFTNDFIRSEEKAIESHIFKHFMSSHAGTLSWMDQLYNKNNKNNKNMVHEYLKGWGNYLLFGETTDNRGNLALKEVIDSLIVLNSRNKIAFSIPTQFINLSIGQAMDLIMEPGAYTRGLRRLATQDKNGVWGYQKAFKLLKKYGLADIINDHAYKKLDEQMKFLNVSAQEIADAGYWLMSKAEELNQFPVFVGLMTEAEWNAYDGNTNVVDSKNQLTFARKTQIAHRVRFIHGMYGKVSTAPMWNNMWGKAALQFRKWLPPLIWNQLAPYYIDQTFFERSGIIPTLWSTLKTVQYNLSPVSVRQKRLAKAIEEKFNKAKNESDKMSIKDTRDHINSQMLYANGIKDLSKYVKTLASELEAGRVSWKQFSLNDRKNLMIAARFLGSFALRYMVLAMIYGREEEKGYMEIGKRTFIPFFTRFSNDIMWIYSWENWSELKESPMPMLSLIINSGEFLIDLVTLEKYEKDSIYGYQGLAKAAVSWTYVSPYGAAIRNTWRWFLKKEKQLRRADIYDMMDVLPSSLQELLRQKEYSQFEVLEMAHRARKAFPILTKGLTAIELERAGISLEDYAGSKEYTRRQKKKLEDYSDMIKLLNLEELEYIGDHKLKDVMKKGKEMSDAEKAAKVVREKRLKQQLDRINQQ